MLLMLGMLSLMLSIFGGQSLKRMRNSFKNEFVKGIDKLESIPSITFLKFGVKKIQNVIN